PARRVRRPTGPGRSRYRHPAGDRDGPPETRIFSWNRHRLPWSGAQYLADLQTPIPRDPDGGDGFGIAHLRDADAGNSGGEIRRPAEADFAARGLEHHAR